MAFPGQNIRKSQPQSSPLIFHDITQFFGFPRNSETGQSFRCLVAILVSEPLLSNFILCGVGATIVALCAADHNRRPAAPPLKQSGGKELDLP